MRVGFAPRGYAAVETILSWTSTSSDLADDLDLPPPRGGRKVGPTVVTSVEEDPVFGKKKKKKAALDLSALSAQVAALRSQVAELAKPAADKPKPSARELAHRASDAAPSLDQVVAAAVAAAGPAIQAAKKKAGPAVESARQRAVDAAHDLEPYVDSARDHVKSDVLPRVRDAYAAGYAASQPYRDEASRRGVATVAALKGEIDVKPQRHVGRNLVILSGFAGLVFVAYKYLTGESSTSGWQTPVSAPAPVAGQHHHGRTRCRWHGRRGEAGGREATRRRRGGRGRERRDAAHRRLEGLTSRHRFST